MEQMIGQVNTVVNQLGFAGNYYLLVGMMLTGIAVFVKRHLAESWGR